MKLTRLLTHEEYIVMTDWSLANGYWRNDPRVFTPGMAFPQPWYHDPLKELRGDREPMFISHEEDTHAFLSAHYWRDHAATRAPWCIIGPNGENWDIDRKSANGSGWIVSGTWPKITISPSIVLDGYHGFLNDGEFGPDLEGRGPNGISRTITNRYPDTPPIATFTPTIVSK